MQKEMNCDLLPTAVQTEEPQGRTELLALDHPVEHHGQRDHHQVRSTQLLVKFQMRQKRNRLQRLSYANIYSNENQMKPDRKKDIGGTDGPSPISSARMQLRPFSYLSVSQEKPAS